MNRPLGIALLAMMGVILTPVLASAQSDPSDPCKKEGNVIADVVSAAVQQAGIDVSTPNREDLSPYMRAMADIRLENPGFSSPTIRAYGVDTDGDGEGDKLTGLSSAPVYTGMDLGPDGKYIGAIPGLEERTQRGQNMWVGYSYDSPFFWHKVSQLGGVLFDPLKVTGSSKPAPGDAGAMGYAVERVGRMDEFGVVRTPGYVPVKDDNGYLLPDRFGIYSDVDTSGRWQNYECKHWSRASSGARIVCDNLVLKGDFNNPLPYDTYGTQSQAMGWVDFINPKFVKKITLPDGTVRENPQFDMSAVDKWAAGMQPLEFTVGGKKVTKLVNTAFYTGQKPGEEPLSYIADKSLHRPIMRGATCGACHIDENPINPPANRDYPKMENLVSTVGRPNFVERMFIHEADPHNFFYQFESHMIRSGNDTSRLTPNDGVYNGDNEINGQQGIFARFVNAPMVTVDATDPEKQPIIAVAKELYSDPVVKSVFGGKNMFTDNGDTVTFPAMRVLKDGADDTGAVGGLFRVPFNIGNCPQETMAKANLLSPYPTQREMSIKTCAENHAPTQTAMSGLVDEALFLLQSPSQKLADAPGGREILKEQGVIDGKGDFTRDVHAGQDIFAAKCLSCHNNEVPETIELIPSPRARASAYQDWLAENVDHLREKGYWGNDKKLIPVDELGTDFSRALGTNATEGDLWGNWSTRAGYKSRPQIGPLKGVNGAALMAGREDYVEFQPEAGGLGYYRTLPLNSLWFYGGAGLGHGNGIGGFADDTITKEQREAWARSNDPRDRVAGFNYSFRHLMNPDQRLGLDSVWTTDEESVLKLPPVLVPRALATLAASSVFPWDGKTINPETGTGINRMRLPGREGLTDKWSFKIGYGESKIDGKGSLVLDYESPKCGDTGVQCDDTSRGVAGAPANPGPIRAIHDEVRPVTVQTGTRGAVTVFVGPAMAKSQTGGEPTEVLWFALSPTQDKEALDILSEKTADELRDMYTAAGDTITSDNAKAQVEALAGSTGKPAGRMLNFTGVDQNETAGPVHDLLAAAGINDLPALELAIPAGTPLALVGNIEPDAMPKLFVQLFESGAAQRYASIKTEEGRKQFFTQNIAPILQQNLKAGIPIPDAGHTYGTTADPETNGRPFSDKNPRGYLTPEQQDQLRKFLLTL